jgi:hypothetical protein
LRTASGRNSINKGWNGVALRQHALLIGIAFIKGVDNVPPIGIDR